jgi:hypothetical protein
MTFPKTSRGVRPGILSPCRDNPRSRTGSGRETGRNSSSSLRKNASAAKPAARPRHACRRSSVDARRSCRTSAPLRRAQSVAKCRFSLPHRIAMPRYKQECRNTSSHCGISSLKRRNERINCRIAFSSRPVPLCIAANQERNAATQGDIAARISYIAVKDLHLSQCLEDMPRQEPDSRHFTAELLHSNSLRNTSSLLCRNPGLQASLPDFFATLWLIPESMEVGNAAM